MAMLAVYTRRVRQEAACRASGTQSPRMRAMRVNHVLPDFSASAGRRRSASRRCRTVSQTIRAYVAVRAVAAATIMPRASASVHARCRVVSCC
jgi:hypothetical protein